MKNLDKLSFCRLFLVIGLVAAIGLVVTPVMAQNYGEPEEFSTDEIVTEGDPGPDLEFEESFGQNYQATMIPAADFTPINSSTTYGSMSLGYRHINSGARMVAGIRLPSGALLQAARLYYYDDSALHDPSMEIFRWQNTPPAGAELCRLSPSGGRPGYSSSASGCASINHTIANGNNTYEVRVILGIDAGADLRFKGVRLYWKRQVRTGLPNPFDDIGGLPPRFQNAIKALAASGITQGCDANSYCPSRAVTRGQMAVFLAEALGLYWAYPIY